LALSAAKRQSHQSRQSRPSRIASAFQIETGPQPLLLGLFALLGRTAALTIMAALAAHLAFAWWLLTVIPLAAWLGFQLARIEPHHLHWDGELWRHAPAALREPRTAVRIEVLMDFGGCMLLLAQSAWRRHYQSLASASVGPAWGQLRATLYFARPTEMS